ncbi:22003_t:CDS:1, partial [Racocetra persica]
HQLLKARYLDMIFLDKDLANAIQHFKNKYRNLKQSDASQLFSFLTKKQFEESE